MNNQIGDDSRGLNKNVGFGNTIIEAFDSFVEERGKMMATLGGQNPQDGNSILFTGISVDIKDSESVQLLQMINSLNDKWLGLCSNFIKNPKDREQKAQKEGEAIQLQNKHHVTLFFYGRFPKDQEKLNAHVQVILKQFENIQSPYKDLMNILTPYEFAVSLLYKRFYNLPYPFEVSNTDEGAVSTPSSLNPLACCVNPCLTVEGSNNSIKVNLRHLILVPNVVLCATASFERPTFSIAEEDGKFEPYQGQNNGLTPAGILDELWKNCLDNNGILISQNHCTHVTLGTSKGYKPVISSDVCDAICNYLAFAQGVENHHEHLEIIQVTTFPSATKMDASHVIKSLDIPRSAPCPFGEARSEIISLLPLLLEPDLVKPDLQHVIENVNANTARSHPVAPKPIENIYKDTKCYVADDKSWFYFKNLPVNSDHVQPNFIVDAYLVPINKTIDGHMRFF
ncbi:hypothetical protein BdWA1_001330 [Babesia duncani]|uniref:Uncharacterized protein n=1 Tax=Babesia duncani TaxID=323732 RepID=A0AAD9PP31_9APIC|nr:hypothetical protein BdWA1_001330 [Babesia duncani]